MLLFCMACFLELRMKSSGVHPRGALFLPQPAHLLKNIKIKLEKVFFVEEESTIALVYAREEHFVLPPAKKSVKNKNKNKKIVESCRVIRCTLARSTSSCPTKYKVPYIRYIFCTKYKVPHIRYIFCTLTEDFFCLDFS
jgi:hypothetical protein